MFSLLQKIQEMEEKRIEKVGESMKTYAEVNRKVLPIVSKCLDGMTNAAASIEPTMVSSLVRVHNMVLVMYSHFT